MYRLKWDSSTNQHFHTSGVLFIKERFDQPGASYIFINRYAKKKTLFCVTESRNILDRGAAVAVWCEFLTTVLTHS